MVIDKWQWGTYFTPITFIGLPFVAVCFLSIIFLNNLGLPDLRYEVLLIWIVGLLFFWLGGFLWALQKMNMKKLSNKPIALESSSRKQLFLFGFILFVVYVKAYLIANKHGFIFNEDFEKDFGSGITGHGMMVLRIVLIYLIITSKKRDFFSFIIIALTLGLNFLYQVKSWILIPVIAGLVGRIILNKSQVSIGKMLLLPMIAFGVFVGVYTISLGTEVPFSFFTNHFLHYLFSGTLGMSMHLDYNYPVDDNWVYLFNPLINIFNAITGTEISSNSSDFWIHTGANWTNVKTFFGTIYIYGGVTKGIIISMIFGMFYYSFLFFLGISRNIYILVVYVLLLACLFFGWFDSYMMNLTSYEVPVLGILFFLISKSKFNIRGV